MRGWILKKATTTYMGMANWQRRYLILKNNKLYFYESDQENGKAKKMIDMKNVRCVCYHYDQDAPIKSKKLDKD